jgi:hypothetical protein
LLLTSQAQDRAGQKSTDGLVIAVVLLPQVG